MPTNRILTDRDREELKSITDRMYRLLPMSGHKITDAMVQEAFVYDIAFDAIQDKISARGLAAGSFHDVAAELLRYDGYAVYDVDPVVNYDLAAFCNLEDQREKYTFIVSTSVLEHTADPKEFITQCCQLLDIGGICVMTMDFKDDWKHGDPVPYTSNRFFTRDSLYKLRAIIQENGCDLVDEPDWTAKDRFIWDGINYSFASFVFRKKE
jgi:hypothetical protein